MGSRSENEGIDDAVERDVEARLFRVTRTRDALNEVSGNEMETGGLTVLR